MEVKKPEDLGYDITMEDVEDAFLKGSDEDILERAVGIIEDTQNQHKRGSLTLDVCFNLEVIKIMVKNIVKKKSKEAA
mgnify:CR=1 FL=1